MRIAGSTRGEGALAGGLFAPLNHLPQRLRWAVVLAATALTTGWCALLNGNLMVAWGLPDVQFYVDMAHGRFDLVPAPFSARPLAPLLARWIAAASGGWSVERAMAALAFVSLAWTVGVVVWLLTRTAAPRWTVLAVVAVPFWPQLLGDAGLPDPLYAALLAVLLVALERDWMPLVAGMMFPLMIARESTWLLLLCLLAVGWRRLGWRGCAAALLCAAAGAVLVRRLSAGSLPNPEHLSGGLYLLGKVVSNSLRSLGVVPWSNVYTDLCAAPVWRTRVPLGAVGSVGVCSWVVAGPLQASWALLTTFGALPVVLVGGRASWRRNRVQAGGRADTVLRFCVAYGGASFLIAPALGTWYARLFGYGWPLLLVAVPRLLRQVGADSAAEQTRWRSGWWASFLALHLLVCAAGDRPPSAAAVGTVAVLESAAAALFLVQGRRSERAQTTV